jgi:adhesin/invasin
VINPRSRFVVNFGLLLTGLTAGCGGDVVLPGEGEAASIEIVDGNEQTSQAGTALPNQGVVRVLDTRDRPVANQEVSFSIGTGGGSVTPATVETDADGEAAAAWTLGPTTGTQLLRAQTPRGGSGTLEVGFSAEATPGAGSNLVEVGGDEQTGPVNSALADSLVVRTTDALGNPVAGVEVSWTVAGGGSISPATVITGADGLAAAERVLGATAGAQSAQAAVEGFAGPPVTFTHTAVPANPTVMVLVSGDDQTAPGGFEVAEDLVVRLEDANGNGIGGRSITWVATAGSGSVAPSNTTTTVNGLATTRWTLPDAVGSYTVSAVFSGLPPVTFSATATADAPTTIELMSGNNQSGSVGSTLPDPLVVRVSDANGIPVANVGVTWTAEVGGSVSASATATNASGLAQVTRTLGLLPGVYTTIAAVEGLTGSPITFTSTATVGSAAKLAIITQPGGTATSGQQLSPQPEIEVQDLQGNPILQAGRTVSASITSSPEEPDGPGSATLTAANDNTNASGRTTYTNLRITGPAGDYVLTFSSGALTPVISTTITLGAGGASRLVIDQAPPVTVVNGAVISPAPVIGVEDAGGNPVNGTRNILVDIGDGQGTLSGTTTENTNGGSTATFDNLRITGVVGPRTLLFSSAGTTSIETATINVVAGPATSMAIEDGDNQSAGVNEPVPTPPSVLVTDQSGNPVSGVSVSFQVTGGGGDVEPASVATNSAGIAAVTSWTLGPAAGPNTVVASIPSAPAAGTETFDATATVANSPPTAADDGYAVDEDQPLVVDAATGVLSNDDDPDGDDLTAVLVAGPSNAQAFDLDPDGSFTFTPDPDFSGQVTFTYQANDGDASSNTATVTITVNEVNDPPIFQPGGNQEASSTISSLTGVTVPGWATDIGPGPPNESAQTVSFEITTNNDGAFSTPPQVSPTGTLTYTPLVTASTIVVTVTVVARDSGGAESDPQFFDITINP